MKDRDQVLKRLAQEVIEQISPDTYIQVLRDILVEEKEVGEIAATLDRSTTRVKQYYNKGKQRIFSYLRRVHSLLSDLEELKIEKAKQNQLVIALRQRITELHDINAKLAHQLGVAPLSGEEKQIDALQLLYAIPLDDLDIGVRLYNNLKAIKNIKNFGDIVSRSEDYYLSQRNFGKKSLVELIELVEGKGCKLKEV